MTARARIADETFVDYRINLRKEARDLHQRLKGFWRHISIEFTRQAKLDDDGDEMKDPLTGKGLFNLVKNTHTYTNPKRAAIKADRGARRMHNKINKPAQVHNHG